MMGALQGAPMLNIFNCRLPLPVTIKNKRGMTLIEILIVMALIAGLMSILVSKIWPMFSKGERRQAEIKMRGLVGAIEMYRTDCQRYPASLQALLTKPPECKNWGPEPYVKNAQEFQDTWGNEFVYENQNSTFTLKSYGKDGVEGGSGNGEDFTTETIQ
jgi:general secretion pathway protein G